MHARRESHREREVAVAPLIAVTAGCVRAFTSCLLVGAFALAALVVARGVAADEASPLERYPGRLVDVGGHDLHIDCRGRGGPVIVLESGIGGFSLEWRAVQAALSPRTRVCAYDRAGYGWSEPANGPRTAAGAAAELHELLAAAGEAPPYLLAGHSYGGLIVREFAARWPHAVAGVALIDAAAPEQFARLPAAALPRAYLAALGGGGRVFSMPRAAAGFPAAQRTLGLQLMMLPKARLAYRAEMRDFEHSARRLMSQGAGAITAPLVVISRARDEFGPAAGGSDAEHVWGEMQTAMRQLSRHADHWLAAGAGHQVHADRPDLVALALRELGDAARMTARAADAFALAPTFARLVLSVPPPVLAAGGWSSTDAAR
ncbi:MAG: alpha/beta fold hydrolase [Gammaproteobacteria bacterium]